MPIAKVGAWMIPLHHDIILPRIIMYMGSLTHQFFLIPQFLQKSAMPTSWILTLKSNKQISSGKTETARIPPIALTRSIACYKPPASS